MLMLLILEHRPWQCFFAIETKSIGNKTKNKQVGLHQTKMILHNQGNHQQNEKATYGMGENTCRLRI